MHDSLVLAGKQEAQQSLSRLIMDYVTARSQHLQVQQSHGNANNNTLTLHKRADHSAEMRHCIQKLRKHAKFICTQLNQLILNLDFEAN